jgi:hypothetical protein
MLPESRLRSLERRNRGFETLNPAVARVSAEEQEARGEGQPGERRDESPAQTRRASSRAVKWRGPGASDAQ